MCGIGFWQEFVTGDKHVVSICGLRSSFGIICWFVLILSTCVRLAMCLYEIAMMTCGG